MKKIYLVSYCDEFEAEGFMDEEQNMIGYWSLNDAHWRSEYFNSTFQKLGIKIENGSDEMQEQFRIFIENEWS